MTSWLPSGGDPVPLLWIAHVAYSWSRPRVSPSFTSGEVCAPPSIARVGTELGTPGLLAPEATG